MSFEAGQAAFTVTIVILFNIIAPAGWRVGLVRIEDVAIGFAVSLVVGLLFWPRGAAKALAQELAEAYADSARYLAAAVEFGAACCDRQVPPPPDAEALRAAATGRRLDDAFRTFLAERAAKKVPLADVTGLVNGVVGVRLAADAVLDLWERGVGAADGGDREAARAELTKIAGSVVGWYDELAAALVGPWLRPRSARSRRGRRQGARRRSRARSPRRRRERDRHRRPDHLDRRPSRRRPDGSRRPSSGPLAR